MGYIIAALFFASVGWGFWIVIGNNRRIRKNFVLLGERFGLETDITRKYGVWAHPVAQGTYEGHTISIRSDVTSGRQKAAITDIKVSGVPKRSLTFGFAKNGMLNRSIQRDRFPDTLVATGDEAFDKAILTVTNQPETLLGLLDDALKARIRELVDLGMTIRFFEYDGSACIGFHGGLINKTKVRAMVEEIILLSLDLDEILAGV